MNTHSRRFDFLYALRFYLLIVFGACLVGALSARATVIKGPPPAKPSGRSKAAAKSATARTNRFARPEMAGAVVVSTLGLLTTWTLAGHAAAGVQTPAAEAADLLHLGAMSVWLGGLAVLIVGLRPVERASDVLAGFPVLEGCVQLRTRAGDNWVRPDVARGRFARCVDPHNIRPAPPVKGSRSCSSSCAWGTWRADGCSAT